MAKVTFSLKLSDLYKSYRIRCLDKGKTPKPFKQYKEIIQTMGDMMSDILLEDGIVGIPWHVGDVFLKQHRNGSEEFYKTINGKSVKVREFNDHSDGIKYRSFWLSPERQHKKRKGWCFSLYDPTRKRLKRLIFAGKRYADWQLLNPRSQMRGDKKRLA